MLWTLQVVTSKHALTTLFAYTMLLCLFLNQQLWFKNVRIVCVYIGESYTVLHGDIIYWIYVVKEGFVGLTMALWVTVRQYVPVHILYMIHWRGTGMKAESLITLLSVPTLQQHCKQKDNFTLILHPSISGLHCCPLRIHRAASNLRNSFGTLW